MTTGRQLRAVVELSRLLEDRARRALPHIAREINAHEMLFVAIVIDSVPVSDPSAFLP